MCKSCRDVTLPAIASKPVVVANLGLHSHTCHECGLERTCYADPCEFRGRQLRRATDKHVVCFVCKDAAEAAKKAAA